LFVPFQFGSLIADCHKALFLDDRHQLCHADHLPQPRMGQGLQKNQCRFRIIMTTKDSMKPHPPAIIISGKSKPVTSQCATGQ